MALEWPDFSQATITDASCYEALKNALAERCAAASAGYGYHYEYPAPDDGAAAAPDLERLTELRTAIRNLAPRFVRLEDERYRLCAWSIFPASYSSADVMKGEHSLAILPAPGTPEASAEHLQIYRTFLANCAWWLRQFRYVNVTGASYYTLRSTARGSIDIWDLDGGDHREWGDEPGAVMASPETRRVDQPADGYMIRNYHVDGDRWEDDFYGRDTGWKYDVGHYQYRSVESTSYSGLVVRNFSGLDGSLLLVPCYTKANRYSFPTRHVGTVYVDSLIPTSATYSDGDLFAGDVTFTGIDEEKHGSAWLETKRQVSHGTQSWRQAGESSWDLDQLLRTTVTKTDWSLDGTRSHSETSSSETTDWYDYTIWEPTETRIQDFDGFGEWTLGVPIGGSVVPAHDRLVAIPERTEIPFPDDWDLTGYRTWRPGLHPRDRDDTVSATLSLRIVPILDFNPSYLYQG